MTARNACTTIPYHSFSTRGAKLRLRPDADVFFPFALPAPKPNQPALIQRPTRRRILQYGLGGAAALALPFGSAGTCRADVDLPDVTFWGLTGDIGVNLAAHYFAEPCWDFLARVFRDHVPSSVWSAWEVLENALKNAIDALKKVAQAFLDFFATCARAVWPKPDSTAETFHRDHGDLFWMPKHSKKTTGELMALKVPMQKWPATGDRKYGIGNDNPAHEPFDQNVIPIYGMRNADGLPGPDGKLTGQYAFPTDLRGGYQAHRKSFELLNRLYADSSFKAFTPEEFKYAVPLIDPIKGTVYTGFHLERDGKPTFLTTWQHS